MGFTLADHNTVCFCADRHIFLDLYRDRYFQLTDPQEETFRRLLANQRLPAEALRTLEHAGVLKSIELHHNYIYPVTIDIPDASLLEHVKDRDSFRPIASLQALQALGITQALFKCLPLYRLMERVSRRKQNRPANTLPDWEKVAGLVQQFLEVRRLYPAKPVCLFDSVAMVEFLSYRQVFPDLVFGVRRYPFAAHCWVQWQGWILNEAVDHAKSHTPILVV